MGNQLQDSCIIRDISNIFDVSFNQNVRHSVSQPLLIMLRFFATTSSDYRLPRGSVRSRTQSRAEDVQFGRDAHRSLKTAQRTLAQQKEAAKPQRSLTAAAAVRTHVVAATNALSGRAKSGMDV